MTNKELYLPFCCHAKEELNAFISFEKFRVYHKHPLHKTAHKNVYCDKAFCERLLRVPVSRVSTNSKIMLGDLSRHYADDADKKDKKLTTIFSLCISRSQLQTICSNKTTSKQILLKGNRVTRLHELVEKLQEEFHILQKLFTDCALLRGNEQCLTSSSG